MLEWSDIKKKHNFSKISKKLKRDSHCKWVLSQSPCGHLVTLTLSVEAQNTYRHYCRDLHATNLVINLFDRPLGLIIDS